jgi:ribonuclease E
MSKEILINTAEGQESRIAIVKDRVLEELYIERVSSASRVGNIYKGKITNVEPSIQAAFVDFGLSKNGFLHVSDVQPAYFPKHKGNGNEAVGHKRRRRDRPPIQECLRRGQEAVVQMIKEGIGTKGPTLTTYLSIPGRLLVMMPGMSCLGVSRKIDDEAERDKAREALADLKLPPDMGFILRTAGIGRSKRELQRDLNYLTRLWKSVKQRIQTAKAPAEIYQESDLVIRTMRDIYNTDVDRIICDHADVARRVKEFLDMAMPRTKYSISIYTGNTGLFHDYGLEQEIEKIYSRRVELPAGGSLVIDQTEALVAIDVNSGRFREHTDAETNALKINLKAAREIARQLRLRDMGGVIIIDFIDMRLEHNRKAVERELREAMKVDRAKTKLARISPFGIVEMTRQRVRPSLKQSIYSLCPHCAGSGYIKSEESLALQVMRNLQRACANPAVERVRVAVAPAVAYHLSNQQRRQIAELEDRTGKEIHIIGDEALLGDQVHITCFNNRDAEVAWESPLTAKPKASAVTTVKLREVHVPAGSQAEEDEELQAEEVLPAEAVAQEEPGQLGMADQPAGAGAPAAAPPAGAAAAPPPAQPNKRRRGRRGGRRHRRKTQAEAQAPQGPGQPGQPSIQEPSSAEGAAVATESVAQPRPPEPASQVPPGRHVASPAAAPEPAPAQLGEPQTAPGGIGQGAAAAPAEASPPQPTKKSRRRGSRGGRRHKKVRKARANQPGQAEQAQSASGSGQTQQTLNGTE